MSDINQNRPKGTDSKHPICPRCDVPMWLVEYRPGRSSDEQPRQVFLCKVCGSNVVLSPTAD